MSAISEIDIRDMQDSDTEVSNKIRNETLEEAASIAEEAYAYCIITKKLYSAPRIQASDYLYNIHEQAGIMCLKIVENIRKLKK